MGFSSSSYPFEMKVVTLAVMDRSGQVVTTPERAKKGPPTIPEMLGKWDKNSCGFWSLDTALLLGLSGKKDGPFELLTFGLKPADCRKVLQGRVLGVSFHNDSERKQTLATISAIAEECLWQFICQRELLEPAAVFFISMPSWVSPQSFNHHPGYDFGLGEFCEPKVGPVNGEAEEKTRPGRGKGSKASAKLAQLRKKPLHLRGEKTEHTGQFCCDKVIPRRVQEAFVAGSQLGLLKLEVKEHFDRRLVADWKEKLNEALVSLTAFEEKFLDKTDIPAKFSSASYPHHKAQYCGQKLVPQLVQTLAESAQVLLDLPDKMRPLLPRGPEAPDMAGQVCAAMAGIRRFLPLLTA